MRKFPLALLVVAVLTFGVASAGDGHVIVLPEKILPPTTGVKGLRLVVEKEGRWMPMASWSPCEADMRAVKFGATIEAAPGARYGRGTLIGVLTVDVVVADSEYPGKNAAAAERDLGWGTLQEIQTPQVKLLEKVVAEETAFVEFPPLPIGPSVSPYVPARRGVRIVALRVRVQVASRSLEVLADRRATFPVGDCKGELTPSESDRGEEAPMLSPAPRPRGQRSPRPKVIRRPRSSRLQSPVSLGTSSANPAGAVARSMGARPAARSSRGSTARR